MRDFQSGFWKFVLPTSFIMSGHYLPRLSEHFQHNIFGNQSQQFHSQSKQFQNQNQFQFGLPSSATNREISSMPPTFWQHVSTLRRVYSGSLIFNSNSAKRDCMSSTFCHCLLVSTTRLRWGSTSTSETTLRMCMCRYSITSAS